jgi:hypothetical protein
MAPTEPGDAVAPTERRRSWRTVLVEDVREHLLAYIAVAGFCVMGPIFAHMIFPEAPTALVVFGGIAFGVHIGFCALADKLFE